MAILRCRLHVKLSAERHAHVILRLHVNLARASERGRVTLIGRIGRLACMFIGICPPWPVLFGRRTGFTLREPFLRRHSPDQVRPV